MKSVLREAPVIRFNNVEAMNRLMLEEYIHLSLSKLITEFLERYRQESAMDYEVNFEKQPTDTRISCAVWIRFGDFFSLRFKEEANRPNHAFNKTLTRLRRTLLSHAAESVEEPYSKAV